MGPSFLRRAAGTQEAILVPGSAQAPYLLQEIHFGRFDVHNRRPPRLEHAARRKRLLTRTSALLAAAEVTPGWAPLDVLLAGFAAEQG